MMMLRSHTLWMMLLGWLLCLSPVWAQSTSKIYYVTADGRPLSSDQGYKEAWTKQENVTTLETALANAKAGDKVWIKGYEVGSPEGNTVYRAPEGGFKVKSGVKVYGGFSGKESGEADRIVDGQVYRMRYRTVLTGDTGDADADVQDAVNYIFPTSNNSNNREDNRTHVVDVDMTPSTVSGNNNNTEPTVLNGLIIARGHADGTDEYGGGVYIHGDNTKGGIFRIERCFFIANYGTMGGAVYVAAEVKNVNNGANLIDRCSFFNNAAGERGTNMNRGGAVCFIGQGYVFNSTIYNNENGGVIASKEGSAIVNCTITRNTGAGVDGEGSKQDEHLPVYNSVVWGNAMLSTATQDQHNFPDFRYSAYPEARMMSNEGEKNNVVLSDKNNDPGDATNNHPKGPSFTLPSIKIGYNVDFNIKEEAYPQWNWEPLEETSLVDKGSTDLYQSIKFASVAPDVDLNRNSRFGGTSIDIGAYEFQPLAQARRRYVKEGGAGTKTGESWENASGDLQKMIDELAKTEGPGEVWVAGGTYSPASQLINGQNTTTTFRMRDGISVYGGFAGTEKAKSERVKTDYPWEAAETKNIVYLRGVEPTGSTAPKLENNRWSVSATSLHVVWFAPDTYNNPDAAAFKYPTYLDGVCIMRGQASGTEIPGADFKAGLGGGVYMNDANAYLRNCVVKESTARTAGGGVYLKNGHVIGSLIYNCNAGSDAANRGNGGGVFVDETGMVLRSLVTNNTADRGAGVYLNNEAEEQPNYLVLSTSVVSNNTARVNGGVYCHKGGVLMQNTITNNYCPTGTDNADEDASQTGGVYIDTYGTVINSVIWNNKINLTGLGTDDAMDIPVYVKNPTVDKVLFLYNAFSSRNNAIWNNTIQQGTLALGDKNSTTAEHLGPDFALGDAATGSVMTSDHALETKIGALGDVNWIHYYWSVKTGSNLLAMGMPIAQFPEDVLMTPELDITGTDLYDQKPSVGAFQVKPLAVKPEVTGNALIFYVDGENTAIDADGSSWETAHRSLTESVNYLARLTAKEVGNKQLIIRVKGQELWPRFAFANEDPRTATLKIPVTESGMPIVIEGSWQVEGGKAERNPLQFRTILNSNYEGRDIAEGNYHGVNIDPNAQVVLDGFHIINGYAGSSSSALIQSGAGVLAKAGSKVTLRNCILENNTAKTAAAVDARQASNLTMVNCVINNNTNDNDTESVIGVPSNGTYSFDHLTVVNNKGAAPAGLKTEGVIHNSFAAGNTAGSNDTHPDLQTMGAAGALNFTNPTKAQGATLGFDTYLGGYSEFRPLTSSVAAAQIINKGTVTSGLNKDITMTRDRDLGGIPDLGAFEAELPTKGRVYYVRTSDNGGSDSHDGLSWESAFATVRKAVETADKGEVINGEKPQVWVAAGTYRQNPQSGSVNCFEILDGVNVFGAFPKTGTPGMGDRHPFVSDAIYHDGKYQAADYETILMPNTSTNCRVLGQADSHNPNNNSTFITYEYIYVGEGKGDYIKSELEYIPQEGGEYYYGPGNKDGYWKAASQYCDWLCFEETGDYKFFEKYDREIQYTKDKNSLKVSPKKLIQVGPYKGKYNIKEYHGITYYWYTDNDSQNNIYTDFTTSGYYEVSSSIAGAEHFEGGKYHSVLKGRGNYIKVEAGKYYEVGKGFGNYTREGDGYINVGMGNGSYAKVARRAGAFTYPTTWDGFTLREGKLTSALSNSNRNGGAGAAVFTNVTLKNCIVTDCNYTTNTDQIRAAGVYCDEGKIVNCYIQKNILTNRSSSPYSTAYGAGIYLYDGTMYNCIVNANTGNAVNTDGVGIFIENGVFFNNTVVGNKSNHSLRGNGGICVYYKAGSSDIDSELLLYNCISVGNDGFGYDPTVHVLKGNPDIALNGGSTKAYNCVFGEVPKDVTSENCTNSKVQDIFRDFNRKDFRLKDQSIAINMGNDAPVVDGETIFLQDFTDMDFTDRIKDCRVDAGAYESQNEKNFGYTTSQNGSVLTYYVTQTGAGSSSGDSPDNAACAMKLQRILNHAGETAKTNPTAQVIVKVAGYPGYGFVYHANTLSAPNDPQSYTYVVPYGVTLMGGYNEGHLDNQTGKMVGHNWDNDHRDAAQYMTVFSAIKQGTTTQDVNGYHALTFGEKPADWPAGKEKTTLVDGIYLEDGAATSLVPLGDPRTRGGGAIVPEWGHLRNCVVCNNQARQGGGLYVLPGGLVTGCGILQNTATYEGGGVYANNADNAVTASNRGHLISNTIVENTAGTGGGIYLEDGAALTVNSVIWGNQAGSDKNVSGVVHVTFEDEYFSALHGVTDRKWYPFNNCFVEQADIRSNFGVNNRMTADKDSYFGQYFTLKPYSALIDKGMIEPIQQEMAELYALAAYDMQGISRLNNPGADVSGSQKGIDVGAYAYTGGVLPTNLLVKRLFVSYATNVIVIPDMEDKYMGRSFFTSFSTLDDAFDYINAVRQDKNVGADARNSTFEILVAAGTYKPSRMRANAAMDVYDQRLNSFVIPYNVQIYGGFTGEEDYSSGGLKEIVLADGSSKTLESDGKIDAICKGRRLTDFNQNGLYEPWELAGQTTLSGKLDLTSDEQNAYHVVYSERDNTADAPTDQRVLLDGITIMKGITHHSLKQGKVDGLTENEVGRGGGIFTKGVEYALANCRLLKNKAVRGGGIFVWDADLYLFNNLVAANYAANGLDESPSYGGAIFVAATNKPQTTAESSNFRLRAINNLFANNESDNMGGAIALGNSENSTVKFNLSSMNNTFVRNKAGQSPIIFNSYGEASLVNTLLWGNDGGQTGEMTPTVRIRNCASDVDYHGKFNDAKTSKNLLLGTENLGLTGPRFQNPSKQPGVNGYAGYDLWNPIAISPATDRGYGKMKDGEESDPDPNIQHVPNYKSFWDTYIPDFYQRYKELYNDVGNGQYNRYSGPVEPGTGEVKEKPIDIGFYEYQYYTQFSTMPQIYVAEVRNGDGSGKDWENATDDLRGAIIGASNPRQNVDTHRTIYVKQGNYASSLIDNGAAFPINTSKEAADKALNLTIKGACIGTGDVQDFKSLSNLTVHPGASNTTKQLVEVSTNIANTVTFEGFSFTNPSTADSSGIGVKIMTVAQGGQFVLRNSAFRGNRQGVAVKTMNGKLLAVNTLFADNATGLANNATDNITLVNTTFANNTEADMSYAVANTYNSVAWNNKANNMPETADHYNKVFTFTGEAAANNANVLEGPNFRDPLNTEVAKRDYRIRPSLMLLDKGSNALYLQHALGQSGQDMQIPDTEKDLHNTNRKVGDNIDIGAYEYEALLQPIVYVKSNLATGTADGSSWDNATGDLQGAVDLAGVYANNAKDQWAYVFADRNVKPEGALSITLPNVKVYGGMNGEVYMTEDQQVVSQPTGSISAADIVGQMLRKRAGLLMQSERSTLQVLQLNANAVVDGFQINEGAVVNHGTLATSIVGSTNVGTAVTANVTDKDGTLYNSLAYGNVSDVKAVNVTATGTIAQTAGSGNNRAEVAGAGVNRYVTTDHWKYQLNETDTDNLNKGTVDLGSLDASASLIASVGHDRDLIGNKRVRNTVDNGCFETWYLPDGGKATADDYPMGQSVVYVGSGKELLLEKEYTAANAFSPGFLLLEHQAGLRGNRQVVNLTNFAVERLLPQAATTPTQTEGEGAAADEKVYDLAVMPFTVKKAEGIAEGTAEGAKLYSYDSKTRAGFAYKFDKDKGAWTDTKYGDNRDKLTIGWLIEGKPEAKVRFYGESYEENGQPKQLSLKKENHNQPWADSNPDTQGNKFTHKENMSWNLFGSPYLCAMKYADMEYGRVMYGMPEGNAYVTLQTYNAENDAIVDGYIPAGDAVFTQTATLTDYETLSMDIPAVDNTPGEAEQPYAGQQALQVALARTQATRADEATADAADVLQLRAVDEADARTDFDLGSDGVKWNTPGAVPQIYALQNSGRYSLLSAVNREGSVQVGVQLPTAGNYRFFLPEECDLTDYEVVMLHDAQTGQSTDLTEGAYAFTTVEGGDVEARFTLNFVRKDSQLTKGIRVRRLSERSFRIEGLQPGDQIRLFGTDGRQVAAQTAAAATETVETYMPTTAIVEVKRNGRPVGVVKVR